jgi:TfuA protein
LPEPTPKIRVYGGLSLSEEQTLRILPSAEFAGPIQRQDLERDLGLGFQCVVIVDGVFQQVLSVSPGEVLDALRFGIKVYGASSMGAMRAAELESLGMIGVGKVFEEIRKSRYFRDDYLGQAFSPDGLTTHSLPFIDIQLGCDQLVEDGEVTRRQKLEILQAYSELHFSQRNSAALSEKLKAQGDFAIASVAAKVPSLIRSIKKQDALAVLKRVRADLAAIQKWTKKYEKGVATHG